MLSLIHIFPQKGMDKLTTDAIVCILKASDGKLWIGTFGGGLICYDNGRIIPVSYTHLRSEVLNEDGMVVDFTHIKETVMGRLDHRNLNEVVSFNPTAENIARWVCEQIPTCFKVEVRESEGNTVIYEKD